MPTTSTSQLITGRVIKTRNSHPVYTLSHATLESNIAKSLLSEGSIANGSAEFDSLAGTTANTGAHHRAEDFANGDIHVITSDDLTNRNYVVVANYVSNEDTTSAGEVTNPIRINSSTSTTVTSKILDDSSAYKNTSVKVTLTDPYFADPEFSDTNNNYLCTFDTTTINNNVNRLIYTRNVNANSAHTDYSPTITASEDTAWNTQDGYGSYFINGTVSIDSTTGQPSASLYAEDSSFNFLSKNFDVSLNRSDTNVVPIFGRYQAVFSQSGENTVTVTPFGSSSLVLTTDLTSWDSFVNSTYLDTNVPLTNLPISINSTELEKWVLNNQFVSTGFTLQISSTEFTSVATFNNSSYSAPVNIDLANMNFNTKNFYILEKSMETNAAAGSSTLAIEKAINDTTYQNKLTVTNGSLSLAINSDVTSGYYTLLDGYEALESDDLIGGQNGIIQSYNSARVANASDSETVFPRASRSAVSSSYGILENFAVQYNSDESGYVEDVEALTGDNLTHAVTYDVTTLVGQTTTTTEGSSNWSNLIGVKNGALAIVKDSNSSISLSAITFDSNANTYSTNNDNKLSVIDIVCNKVWSESKVYDTDNTVIIGLTADIKSFNMESVPLNLKDIRFILTAKSLSNLSLEPSGNWVLSCPDNVLTTSSEKLGVMDDSTITEKLLTEEDNILGSLFVTIYPRIESMLASKFTKFHYNLETSYLDVSPQITYDDEFTILNYVKSAVTSQEMVITIFQNVPANTKLYKRSYTESFNVKVPFRYGYYSNLFLTSETLSYDIEYYVLTDTNNNNADLPRYYLKGIKDNNGDDIYATVTPTVYSTYINFENKDFKPYNISLQKKTGTDWVDVELDAPAYADLWYNTRSTITSSIGSFYLTLTLPPNVNSLSNPTFYIDLELDKGTSSFTISGKQFTATNLDSMSSTNLNTFSLASYGTPITNLGDVTYARDSDVNPNTQASTTLTAGGYVFKLLGEMYLSIRIFVCLNGIFKCVKTSNGTPSTTYHTIKQIGGNDSLHLDTGVYGYGNLLGAIRNTSSATWSFNNDAIGGTYYGTTGINGTTGITYQRITSLNQEFRPVDNARGFETTIVRGFTPNLSTTITRTLSEVQLDLAGYTFDTDLLNNINDELTFGGITMSSNSATYSMYPANFGTQTWTINLSYGSYTLSDKVDTDSNPVESIVYAYKSIISDRRELKIISTSLNTNNFSYIVQYISSNVLTIRRNPDIVAPNYIDSSGGYVFVTSFTPEQLRDASLNNIVGNILNVHYTQPGAISDMDCYFSITPPYLKFTAIDPNNVSAIPFNSSLQTPVTRYLRVDNSNNSYYPFTSHSSINNIRFEQNNVKQYLEYFTNSNSQVDYMNVDNYNIEVELGSGLDSSTPVTDWSTVYGPTPILNSDFSNNDIDITAPDSSRKFQIFIDQQSHSSFSNFFVYDASFAEYNLQLEIGSSFISGPSNGENSIILEFVAGDSTSLDLYAVESFQKVSDNLEVTIAKYTSGAGISNTFLQTAVSNGFNLPYTSKYTQTVSTSLNSTASLTSTITTLSDHLNALKTSITASTFTAWTSASVGSGSTKLTLLPATTTGKAQLVRLLTHGPIVRRSILSLTLEDHTRLEDIYGVPNYRVTYDGSTHSSSLNLKPTFSQSNISSALPTAIYW